MARFKEIKPKNPTVKQNQIAKELVFQNSTLKRFRIDINMLSAYRNPPNITNKRRQKISNTNHVDNSNREHDV